ncbi:hypothetical protein HF086_014652 [Spodoptera exigua]|uniref:Small ribosomal subunit protein eS1 n=1 Tax=Spodoptera exigua TaxID=7107 RepID=A0A922M5R4_SPOEX|nr:hypothetical protein HF086_014652 [Spodoptera exigua]
MAVGKNKGLSKGGKKGVKKKIVDPFTRKDWYDVKAPSMFTKRQVGTTLVNRTQGTKIASEGLKGRVFEVSLADLQADTDAERWMVKKWQTLVEANIDVKTTDGYLLRVFCIGFTNKDSLSQRKTCYAQHTQVRAIRKKMCEIITRDVTNSELREVVNKLIPDSIAKDIEHACRGIYPLRDVCIRKVKVLKRPRFEISKLMELHGEGGSGKRGEAGDKSERPEGYEPPVQESV